MWYNDVLLSIILCEFIIDGVFYKINLEFCDVMFCNIWRCYWWNLGSCYFGFEGVKL